MLLMDYIKGRLNRTPLKLKIYKLKVKSQTLFLKYLFHLFERDRNRKRSSIHWFTPQMLAINWTRHLKKKLGTQSGFLKWVIGTQVLGQSPPAVSQGSGGRGWNWKWSRTSNPGILFRGVGILSSVLTKHWPKKPVIMNSNLHN